MVITEIVKKYKTKQQKGRRVTSYLQERVDQEIKKTIDLDLEIKKRSNRQCISTFAITAKNINQSKRPWTLNRSTNASIK